MLTVEYTEKPETIIDRHTDYLTNHNINIPEKTYKLPSFYWLPKMHKTPVGNRFIAASDMCTTKALSKLISYCLKLIVKHFREYCNGIKGRTKANCFWIVDSSTPVLDLIDKLNNSASV